MDIKIHDVIGSWWDGTDAKTIMQQIAACPEGEALHVSIHSPGGDMMDGIAIFNALKMHPSRVVVTVAGLAGSAASLIAMAGDDIRMPENAFLMIHNPWGDVSGESKDFEEAAALFKQFEATTAKVYAKRTGKTVEEIQALMDASTWMDGAQALDAGFCTEVTDAIHIAAFAKMPKSMAENCPVKFESPDVPGDASGSEPEGSEGSVLGGESSSIPDGSGSGDAGEVGDEPSAGVPAGEDPEPVKNEPSESLANEAAEIVELCVIAGRPASAAEYIRAGLSAEEVRAKLAKLQLDTQVPVGNMATNAQGVTEELLMAAKTNLTIRSLLARGDIDKATKLMRKEK